MSTLPAIERLCGLLARGEVLRHEFLERLTRQLVKDIGCSRAGVRMLVDTPQGLALRCVAMCEASRNQLVSVSDMSGVGLPVYLEALERDGCVVASNAWTHPVTAAFVDPYLRPSNVHSLLDVSLSVNGVLYGNFSCEQTGTVAQWDPRQLHLLRQIAARASLALMNATKDQADLSPYSRWALSAPDQLVTLPMPLDAEGDGPPTGPPKGQRRP